MALEHTWQKIQRLSGQMRAAIVDDPDRVTDLWSERQTLLQNLLNESSLAALSTRDLTWLRDAVEQLQLDDQALMEQLTAEQQVVIDALKKQQGDARAISAYEKQQNQN